MRCDCPQNMESNSNDILLKGREGSILIKNGRIAEIQHYNSREAALGGGLASESKESTAKIIDIGNCLICPGFTDIHVHFREPGFSYKETIATGSAAAARGGYTTVCAMPNLQPVPDSVENIGIEWEIINKDAKVEVLPYAAITKDRRGKELVDFAELKQYAVAFSDDGSGVQSEEMMYKAMQTAANEDCIIAAHCEDETLLEGGYIHRGRYCRENGHRGICSESEWTQIERDLKLCEKTECRYHICHISCKESVELIRNAKARGLRVSCETAPHYLLLCEDDLQEDGCWKMNPPLRSAEDREALIEGLKDGTIDAIATDHAPHSSEEKSQGLAKSAMGIVGLETAFPVLYTALVRTGKISLERLLEALTYGPRRVMRLEIAAKDTIYGLKLGATANIAIIDLDEKYIIDTKDFASKGHSTPFENMPVWGKVRMTLFNGKIVWTDGVLV